MQLYVTSRGEHTVKGSRMDGDAKSQPGMGVPKSLIS